MNAKLQINLNDHLPPLSPKLHRAESTLFTIEASPRSKLIHEDEDDLCPWSNTLESPSPMKLVQTTYNTTSTWARSKKGVILRKRSPSKEQTSLDEKIQTKPFRFYKGGGQKASENSSEVFSHDLLKYRVTPPMTRIGLVDLSTSKTYERQHSKPQLIIGSVEELEPLNENSRRHSGIKSRGELAKEEASPLSKTQGHFKKAFGVKLKEVETTTDYAETIKNYFKVYSQTARSLKDLKLKKGEDIFHTPNKGKVHKKILGREDYAQSISKRLESKNLYANVLTQNTKTNPQQQPNQEENAIAGIISEGLRIVGSQRHSRNPSRALTKRNKGAVEYSKEEIKDKLQILKKIRTQSQVRNIPGNRDEHKMSGREERNSGSPLIKSKIISPINFQKTYTKIETSKEEASFSPTRAETEGMAGSHHYTLPQVVNNASNISSKSLGRSVPRTKPKHGGNFNEELRKLLAYKERTESMGAGTDIEMMILKTDGNEDERDDVLEKPRYVSSPKFRTTMAGLPLRHDAPRRERTEAGGLIRQDIITKSFSHVRLREAPIELRGDMFKIEPMTQFLQSSVTPSRLALGNAMGRKVIKRSNFEIQAAMLQEQKAQKTIKTFKT